MATLIYQPLASIFGNVNHDSSVEASDMADKTPQENPSFFKGEFSFVNKDAKNIDSKDHNAAVSWHVMNRYERWKKQEQARKLRASANVPVGSLSPPGPPQPTSSPIPTVPFGFDPWMGDQPLQAGYPTANPHHAAAPGPLSSRTSTPSTQSSVLDGPFSSIWNTSNTSLDIGTADEGPDSFNVPTSPLINSLIAYAYGHLVAQSWPPEPGSVQGAYEIARCWDDIAAVAQDKCYSNAYLGVLAGAMAETNNDESLAIQSRQFQAQAMTELRQRATRQSPQDLLTLKAILKLFSAETIVDNTAVARVHLKMLRNLVTAGGGVILLDSWFREDLLSCDSYFALKYGTRPTLPTQEWTPGPLSQPWKARLVSAGIFGDHSATIDPLIAHSVLKAVITDLRELFKAQEYILTHEVPTDDQLLRWRQLRKFDCISRLADHYTNLAIYAHLYDSPKTQAMTTIAIALLTNMVLGSPEPVRFGMKLLDDLREKLRDNASESDGDDARLRLWATYVGSLAERVHPVAMSNASFFAGITKTLARELQLEGWDDVKKILKQFLFSEKLHQEVESGRAFRKTDFRKGLYSSSGTSWREPLSADTAPSTEEGSPAAGKRRDDDG